MTFKKKYTKLKLMPEVSCWAVWDINSDENINPDDLPLTNELKKKIYKWTSELDDFYDIDHPEFPHNLINKHFDRDAYYNEGKEILHRLRIELPNIEWYYQYEGYIK